MPANNVTLPKLASIFFHNHRLFVLMQLFGKREAASRNHQCRGGPMGGSYLFASLYPGADLFLGQEVSIVQVCVAS